MLIAKVSCIVGYLWLWLWFSKRNSHQEEGQKKAKTWSLEWMNEKQISLFHIWMWIFFVWEKCLFCEFLPRVFQETEGGQKRHKKDQEGGQKSNKRRLKEGQNEDMISLFHMYMNVDFFFNLGKVFIMWVSTQSTLCFLLNVPYFSLVLQYIKILYGTFNRKHRVLLYWEQQQKSLKGLKGEKKVKLGSLE